MSDEKLIKVEIPLDDDGFLRRLCASCGREFKWLHTEGDGEPMPEGGYACPYCRVRGEDWLTESQRDWALAEGANQAVGPMLEEAGLHWEPNRVEAPIEVNDMERIAFSCHPAEAVKVLDGWAGPVHCLICAQPAGG